MGMLEVVMLAMMGCMVVFGMQLGMQMDPASWQFTDRLNLVICNTLFMKQESKLVTYVAVLLKVQLIIGHLFEPRVCVET